MQESLVSCGDLVGQQGKHVCSVHNLVDAVFTTKTPSVAFMTQHRHEVLQKCHNIWEKLNKQHGIYQCINNCHSNNLTFPS